MQYEVSGMGGTEWCETIVLNRITRKGLSEKATFEQKLEGGRADRKEPQSRLLIPGVCEFQANGRTINALKKSVLYIFRG